MNLSGPANMGFQLLGVAVQGNVARAADRNFRHLAGRDVHIAMAADTDFGVACRLPRQNRPAPILRC